MGPLDIALSPTRSQSTGFSALAADHLGVASVLKPTQTAGPILDAADTFGLKIYIIGYKNCDLVYVRE
jgi:hypothetical protein